MDLLLNFLYFNPLINYCNKLPDVKYVNPNDSDFVTDNSLV